MLWLQQVAIVRDMWLSLQYTSTKEEKFMVSIKTGAFGIAIVAYFYTTEYCHNLVHLF